MYYIVQFRKPAKHLVGAKNIDLQKKGGYKHLIDAEIDMLALCKNKALPEDINYRIDDTKYNESKEFFDRASGKFYFKPPIKNAYGKYSYDVFTMTEYEAFIKDKVNNPFSQVI